MMNFVGSFFGSFATAGALSRTILQEATGGHTQVTHRIKYCGYLSCLTCIYVVGQFGVIRNCFNCHLVSWASI